MRDWKIELYGAVLKAAEQLTGIKLTIYCETTVPFTSVN